MAFDKSVVWRRRPSCRWTRCASLCALRIRDNDERDIVSDDKDEVDVVWRVRSRWE